MEDGDRTTLDRISLELDQGTSDLNLKQLYYFHAVAIEGTIVRAAKKLKVSQATISEQLKNLELYLEQPLLERRTTGVRLNQYGRRVFEHTTAMFRAVNRMLQDINPARARDRWLLEVGICPTISRTFAVDRFLPLFMLETVSLRVRRGRYEDLMEALLTGEIDLVLSENRPTEQESQKLGRRVLQESPLVFVASPEMAAKVSDFPKDLGELPFLAYGQATHYRWDVEGFMVEAGIAPSLLGEVDDVGLMAAAASGGMCFVAVPRNVVEAEIGRNELVVLGPVGDAVARVYALYQSAKTPATVLSAIETLGGMAMEVERHVPPGS